MSSSDSSDEIEEAQKEQQALLQEQIDQQNAEIEQKRQAVFDQRINIIRSQGAPVWSPGKGAGAQSPVPALGKTSFTAQQNPLGYNNTNNNNSTTQQGK